MSVLFKALSPIVLYLYISNDRSSNSIVTKYYTAKPFVNENPTSTDRFSLDLILRFGSSEKKRIRSENGTYFTSIISALYIKLITHR